MLKTVQFQTVQFGVQKQFYFKQFNFAQVSSLNPIASFSVKLKFFVQFFVLEKYKSVQDILRHNCWTRIVFNRLNSDFLVVIKKAFLLRCETRTPEWNIQWNCDFVVSKFELQSRYYVSFKTKESFWLNSTTSSSSSSSWYATSTDIPDPLSPLLPIVHRFWQGYIPYPHRAALCRFELVVLLLLGHFMGSIGVHHLWARPCFSSSVLHVWFVYSTTTVLLKG